MDESIKVTVTIYCMEEKVSSTIKIRNEKVTRSIYENPQQAIQDAVRRATNLLLRPDGYLEKSSLLKWMKEWWSSAN